MKRILHILVAVVTSVCVLIASLVPASAAEAKAVYVDHQGYIYYLDEDNIPVYDYPIELDPDIITYDILDEIQLFTVDGSSAIDLSYVVQESAQNLHLVESGSAAAFGSAAAGGGGAGAVATIASLTTGQVVLFAVLVGSSIMILTEGDLVETALNDVWSLLDHNTQLRLNEMYFQETWLVDEEIAASINTALSGHISISNGVVWNPSLVLSTDDLTGLTTTFPTQPIVVENQLLSDLTVEAYEIVKNGWMTFDKSQSILYKCQPQGCYYNVNGNILNDWDCMNVTILNTITGVQLSYYPLPNSTGGMFHYNSDATYYLSEPVFINDGEKIGLELLFGINNKNSSFYTFRGYSSMMYNNQYPIIMTGTGTDLDGMKIIDVAYNAETNAYTYKYIDPELSPNTQSNIKSLELPFEPFLWVYSQTQPQTADDNAGALNVVEKQQTVDPFGKIGEIVGTVVPQIKPLTVPKIEVETTTEKDPETGEDEEKQHAYFPNKDATNNPDNGNNSNPDSGSNTNPDPLPDPDPMDKNDPDPEGYTNWIESIFGLEHLFDWLPERYSKLFDNIINFVGTLIVTMFIYAIVKQFFPLIKV